MPKPSTQLLTKHQKEYLGQFLKFADKEEVLALTELEGFIFVAATSHAHAAAGRNIKNVAEYIRNPMPLNLYFFKWYN